MNSETKTFRTCGGEISNGYCALCFQKSETTGNACINLIEYIPDNVLEVSKDMTETRKEFEKETGLKGDHHFKEYHEWLEARETELKQENKELRELLQYVATNHLCGPFVIKGMKKLGIENEYPNKKHLNNKP